MKERRTGEREDEKGWSVPIWVAVVTGVVTVVVAIITLLGNLFGIWVAIQPTSTPFATQSTLSSPTATGTSTFTTPASPGNGIVVDPDFRQISNEIDLIQQSNQRLENEVEDVSTRVQNIEDIILDNPAKVLQITLLRNEVDALKAGAERRDNLFTVLIGVLISAGIGILSLSYYQVRQGTNQASSTKTSEQEHSLNSQIENLIKTIALEKAENIDLRNQIKQLNEKIDQLSKGPRYGKPE